MDDDDEKERLPIHLIRKMSDYAKTRYQKIEEKMSRRSYRKNGKYVKEIVCETPKNYIFDCGYQRKNNALKRNKLHLLFISCDKLNIKH